MTSLLPLTKPGWPPPPAVSRQIIRDATDQCVREANPVPTVTRARLTTKLALSPTQRRYIRIISAQGASWSVNAWPEVFAAAYTGLELAVACTTTQLESSGRNIYGADPASAWMNDGPYGRLWENQVTHQNYLWFGARVDAGMTSNGVGAKQLTSRYLQRAADARGGCWVPEHNCAQGDAFFLALLAQSPGSLWTAAYHYNGSGSAAVAYANLFMAVCDEWRARLA